MGPEVGRSGKLHSRGKKESPPRYPSGRKIKEQKINATPSD
jgi:hypothetical protein